MYDDFIKSMILQIADYRTGQETDLVLLRNHLMAFIKDIENDPKFKEQLAKCETD